jgi:hypothetical protein
MIHVSTQLALAELLLSGRTISSDDLYVFPNGVRLADSIAAARDVESVESERSAIGLAARDVARRRSTARRWSVSV